LITVPPDFAHLLEIHLNESEVALDGPVNTGSAFKTDARGRKSRKQLKILYRKHLRATLTNPQFNSGLESDNHLPAEGIDVRWADGY
jgi:hypothetical protein